MQWGPHFSHRGHTLCLLQASSKLCDRGDLVLDAKDVLICARIVAMRDGLRARTVGAIDARARATTSRARAKPAVHTERFDRCAIIWRRRFPCDGFHDAACVCSSQRRARSGAAPHVACRARCPFLAARASWALTTVTSRDGPPLWSCGSGRFS